MRLSKALVSAFWIAIAVAGCGGPGKPPESPSGATSGSATADAPTSTMSATSAPLAAGDLVSQLENSKVTLAQGIQQAEKALGPAISAKFEIEDGHLSLSVYAAKEGLDTDAEHNVLMELAGDPTKDKWEPKSEVFEDKEHVTRAAMHLTLIQRAKTTLTAVLAKASAKQPGTVYSVIPAVKDRKPVFDVLVATPDGKSVALQIDGG